MNLSTALSTADLMIPEMLKHMEIIKNIKNIL